MLLVCELALHQRQGPRIYQGTMMLSLIQKFRSELVMSTLVVQPLAPPVADKNPHIGGALAFVVSALLLVGSSYSVNQKCDRTALITLTAFWIAMRLGEAFDGSRHIFSSLAPISGLLLSCAVLRIILDRSGMLPKVTALVAYRQCNLDVVLLALQMPRTDGLTATREIKKSFSGACIVIVSDYEANEFRAAASTTGASGYAFKQGLEDLEAIIVRSFVFRNFSVTERFQS